MSTEQNRPKPTLLHWLGVLLLVFGSTLTANFIVRQVKEPELGNTYYEFIVGSVLIALVGIVVMVIARRRSRPTHASN